MSASSDKITGRETFWLRAVMTVIVLSYAGLAVALWHVQITQNSSFQSSLDRQSVRRVRLPAPRGQIYDRQGVCLVDNRPSYGLAIYVEELRQRGNWSNTVDKVQSVIQTLAERTGLPNTTTHAQIALHVRNQRLLPFIAWHDVDERVLALVAEHGHQLPGVGIQVEAVRLYTQTNLLAHVLGYVGRANLAQDSAVEEYHFYLPDQVGRSGLEQRFNAHLAGTPGGRLVRITASMLKHEIIEERSPVPGADLRLTLDARIQRLAEAALGTDRGACVILDPRNGDVLALASAPGFDPNRFIPNIPTAEWRRLMEDDAHPLLNRATSGRYPPGSIFKPIVALAALENHRATALTSFPCGGAFRLGTAEFGCWRTGGHETLAMRDAIAQSCNPYFCQLGLQCGQEAIYHMAQALGLGQKTGITVDSEQAGLVPCDAWKRRVLKEGWRSGDTCNISIGQGALLVTPLQMAEVAATIANGGSLLRPRLVLGTAHREVVNSLHWSPDALQLVRAGMHDVVETDHGTGKAARISGVTMAGKTGTAEFGPAGRRRKHTWMILFAPFAAPRYALAMLIEDGVTGGQTVAPRVHDLMAGVFALDGTLPPAGTMGT